MLHLGEPLRRVVDHLILYPRALLQDDVVELLHEVLPALFVIDVVEVLFCLRVAGRTPVLRCGWESYSIAADPPVPRSLRPSAQRIFASRGRLERHSSFGQPSHLTVSLDWEIGPGSQEPGPLLPLSFADV